MSSLSSSDSGAARPNCPRCGKDMWSGLMYDDEGVLVHIKCDYETFITRLTSGVSPSREPARFSHEEQRQKALEFIEAHPPGPICEWCGREHEPHCTGMVG